MKSHSEIRACERIRFPIRVAYVDTDQGGIVHHGAYLRYLETSRVEYLRSRGVNYRDFETEHLRGLPVYELNVRYLKPAHFDDDLEIETWVGVLNRAKLRFDYRIWRGDELLTEAQVTCACVSLESKKIVSVDQRLRDALGA